MELPDGGSVQESMGAPTRSAATVVATLAVSGILASPAFGDQCAVEIRWNNVLYENWEARSAELEPTRSLGDAEIPPCAAGGHCAPPEETVAAYAIAGVPTEAAILVPDYYEELFLAPARFPSCPTIRCTRRSSASRTNRATGRSVEGRSRSRAW